MERWEMKGRKKEREKRGIMPAYNYGSKQIQLPRHRHLKPAEEQVLTVTKGGKCIDIAEACIHDD